MGPSELLSEHLLPRQSHDGKAAATPTETGPRKHQSLVHRRKGDSTGERAVHKGSPVPSTQAPHAEAKLGKEKQGIQFNVLVTFYAKLPDAWSTTKEKEWAIFHRTIKAKSWGFFKELSLPQVQTVRRIIHKHEELGKWVRKSAVGQNHLSNRFLCSLPHPLEVLAQSCHCQLWSNEHPSLAEETFSNISGFFIRVIRHEKIMVKKNGCFYSYVLSYISLPHIIREVQIYNDLFSPFGISSDHPSSVRPQGWKRTVPGTWFQVLLCRLSRGNICLSSRNFPCLKGGVCDFF